MSYENMQHQSIYIAKINDNDKTKYRETDPFFKKKKKLKTVKSVSVHETSNPDSTTDHF